MKYRKALEQIIDRRRQIARSYDEELAGVVGCPMEEAGTRHVYYTYTIQADRRDELRDHPESEGIETKIHHPYLMPQQTAYRENLSPEIPVAEKLVERILSIPNHEKMTDTQVEHVATSIRTFYGA